MRETMSIDVRLPDGLDCCPDDLEVLRTTFQTIISLASRGGDASGGVARDLRAAGWDVSWNLTWQASARRGKDWEEVTGRTREEALDRLREAVGLHDSDGCP